MLKLIVTSATYRQSSRVTAELLARDPRNRLLAHAPRVRLEAEMVRDQALALSGLLSRKSRRTERLPAAARGPLASSVQRPAHLVHEPGRRTSYRRALYTFWRRTMPYPSMATFDAPSREICAIKRVRTNTPLQAFVTLNDPVYVEAAQALARRIVREGGSNLEDRVRYASAALPVPAAAARAGRAHWSSCIRREARALSTRIATRPSPWPPNRSGRFPPAWTPPIWLPGPRSPTCC